jgi:hypothetical protein
MGGQNGTSPRETLAERVAITRARQAGLGHGTAGFHSTPPTMPPASWASLPMAPPSPASPPPPLRHCFYEGPHGRQPALLLKWRCIEQHWDGLIVVAAPDATGEGWAVVEMWTDSALLKPAHTEPGPETGR